jgi:hypothetical protein
VPAQCYRALSALVVHQPPPQTLTRQRQDRLPCAQLSRRRLPVNRVYCAARCLCAKLWSAATGGQRTTRPRCGRRRHSRAHVAGPLPGADPDAPHLAERVHEARVPGRLRGQHARRVGRVRRVGLGLPGRGRLLAVTARRWRRAVAVDPARARAVLQACGRRHAARTRASSARHGVSSLAHGWAAGSARQGACRGAAHAFICCWRSAPCSVGRLAPVAARGQTMVALTQDTEGVAGIQRAHCKSLCTAASACFCFCVFLNV